LNFFFVSRDTAGQERYHAITRTVILLRSFFCLVLCFSSLVLKYYRDAAGVLVVYDVTNAETFSCVRRWMDDIRKSCQDNVVRILVGNKDDTDVIKKEVPTETAEEYAQQLKIPFFETSAKNDKNVQEIFHTVTRLALEQRLKSQNQTLKAIQLNETEKKQRKSCCK